MAGQSLTGFVLTVTLTQEAPSRFRTRGAHVSGAEHPCPRYLYCEQCLRDLCLVLYLLAVDVTHRTATVRNTTNHLDTCLARRCGNSPRAMDAD